MKKHSRAAHFLSAGQLQEASLDVEHLLRLDPEPFLHGLPHHMTYPPSHSRELPHVRVRFWGPEGEGLAFGADRLLTVWLAAAYAACGMPKSREVCFHSLKAILPGLGRPTHLQAQRELRAGLLRVLYTSLGVYDKRRRGRFRSIHLHLMDEVRLMQPAEDGQHTRGPNRLVLSRRFTECLRAQPLPVSLSVARELQDEPAAFDLYAWQAHRSAELHRHTLPTLAVPLSGPGGVLAQLGMQDADREAARQRLRGLHKRVRAVWTGCRNYLATGGGRLVLLPFSSAVQEEVPGVVTREASAFRAAVGASLQAHAEEHLLRSALIDDKDEEAGARAP